MKKLIFAVTLLLAAQQSSSAVVLNSVRHSVSPDKIRLVLDFDQTVECSKVSEPPAMRVTFKNTIPNGDMSLRILDAMVDGVSISKYDTDTNIDITTAYPVENRIFTLQDPYRVVIDLIRPTPVSASSPEVTESFAATKEPMEKEYSALPSDESYLKSIENISYGVSLFRINAPTDSGNIKGYSLLVDPGKADVYPVITVPQIKGREGNSIFGALFSLFGGGDSDQKRSHFAKKRVTAFVKMANAVAGVNGSFFFANGTPVGALIIKSQVISSPLLNRTALILYKDGSAAIDSLKMSGYLRLQNGDTLSFSGVNQPIARDEIMVYTPDYQSTDPSGASTNIVVNKGLVTGITYGETKVPTNGFVISANGTAGESLKELFKTGDAVKWFFMTSPSLDEVAHVVAGGPKLVSQGKAYVSSVEEKFKRDVAIGRAARTAVGITKSGKLILTVIEGSGKKTGATLQELSNLMINLGAYEAMNLDGGGSSTMVVSGKTMNYGAGRAVSNAIVVRPKN